MPVAHENITEAYLHESKGVSTASVGDAYRADGAGSGDWKVQPSYHYADMTITGGTTTFGLAAASAYTKFNPTAEWTAALNDGLTIGASAGEITLVTAGTYLIEFWCSFTTASIAAGAEYNFKYALDGTPNSRIMSVTKNTAGADGLTVAAQGIMTVTASQVLSMHVAGDGTSSSTNITPTGAGLTVVLLRET